MFLMSALTASLYAALIISMGFAVAKSTGVNFSHGGGTVSQALRLCGLVVDSGLSSLTAKV